MYLIWILESRLIRSNNQSSGTLWVLDTCLIVGLLPLMIILITASLSSNTYNRASWREDWTFEGTESMSFITSIRLWDLWCFLSSPSGCPDRSETWETLPKTETNRSHDSRAGKQCNLNPASKEMISDSVELCETEVCFLTHSTCWNKCMTSQNAQCSSRSGFRIFKISREMRVLKQSQSALFRRITHMTILAISTCVMNVWNQSIQAFVTGFGPFCNSSCKLTHSP